MLKKSQLALLISFGCVFSANAVEKMPNLPSLAPMLEKVMPAVVNIAVQGEVMAAEEENAKSKPEQLAKPKKRKFRSIGSGVIVDPDKGYVLTNQLLIVVFDFLIMS